MKMIKQPLNGQIQNRCMILRKILIINFGGRLLPEKNKTLEEKTMSKTEVTVGSDIYSFKELKQLIIDFPIKVNGWVVKENKGHCYLYYEKAFGLSDPLMTLRDPWNRPIRPWIYYTDDNPTIWQYRKAEHPSRNAMFMPTADKASAYAYTSINNKWMFLYV